MEVFMNIKESYNIVQHNIRVSKLAERIAYALGLDDEICQGIAVAGVFMDLGKMAMDNEVFNSSRDLTVDEYEYVKQHTTKSTQILMQANHISKDVLMNIIHHHENYDGTGYPNNLVGNQIPMGARILKICDVFYALVAKRPFREDYSKKEAIQVMDKELHKFDPAIYPIFKDIVTSSKIYM